jgi:hypothetical protein
VRSMLRVVRMTEALLAGAEAAEPPR